VTAGEFLGGLYCRHNSPDRRNRGDDMRQPTHVAGFVQPYRVAKREVVRPEHPDAFVHRPETNAVNLSTERSTGGPPVVISAGNRAGSAAHTRDWCERLIKREARFSKIVEDLGARFTVPTWAQPMSTIKKT
jgi:hypothetical protein